MIPLFIIIYLASIINAKQKQDNDNLWLTYYSVFQDARYIDLTHTISPNIPVWHGFGQSQFGPSVHIENQSLPYTYQNDGFEATQYHLTTDQLGTQLDPPSHWNPYYPSIDELPPTYAVRPLAVISITEQVKKDPNYSLQVQDIEQWEKKNGLIPPGSVVFIRSDWYKDWLKDPNIASRKKFPGVSLPALKFLHHERHILFHGHEPLDTDSSLELEGEAWLLQNGYTQAEGVANLDLVPETGALVSIGFPKFQGGTGGYARYIAICPKNWKYGVSIGEIPESPLQKFKKPLKWDKKKGVRTRGQ